MPDDDWALGQNDVDVRNEARNPANLMPLVYTYRNSEQDWIDEVERGMDLTEAIEHLRILNETPAINADAEQRRQESITRTLDEIQRLMHG